MVPEATDTPSTCAFSLSGMAHRPSFCSNRGEGCGRPDVFFFISSFVGTLGSVGGKPFDFGPGAFPSKQRFTPSSHRDVDLRRVVEAHGGVAS